MDEGKNIIFYGKGEGGTGVDVGSFGGIAW